MPRTSNRKRKAAPPISSSITSPDDDHNPRPVKAKSKGIDRIDKLFYSYANSCLGIIDPEGIEALCSDMQVEHTDIRILMLAWKMKAQKQGFFTKEEWQTGLKGLQADSVLKLKRALPRLEKEVGTPENFQNFYSYSFRYCLTEEKQKCIDIESTCQLLDLVLGSQFRSTVDSLIDYLKVQSDYKGINMDQWMNFLRFCNEMSLTDLGKYDCNQAWPLILDNFVEWMKAKNR
ncbi:hypothetical protein K2173_017806 [Erythroxylum novogranatense]|uniref:Defective in cullin neddylation protein n=1 Tax=Erythroxylum novogranatense TaxID=1862640 RepID=A0AAV8SMH2_9ROSI|nr:hypothetical protein K2173_017806 [Erythroxylum novogranatense]